MKYSIGVKILAIVLAAVALAAAAAGFLAGVGCLENGLYSYQSFENWQTERHSVYAASMASSAASGYAQSQLSTCPEWVLQHVGPVHWMPEETASWYGISVEDWAYEVRDLKGKLLENSGTIGTGGMKYVETVSGWYWELAQDYESYNYMVTDEEGKEYRVTQREGPQYQVTIWFAEDAFEEYGGTPVEMIKLLYTFRYVFLWVFGGGLLLFIGCVLFLCFASGKKYPADTPTPRGLNRIPLDIYLAVVVFGCIGLACLFIEAIEAALFVENDFTQLFKNHLLILAGVCLLVAALLIVGLLYALAAQAKGKNFYWWRNSIVGRIFALLWRGIRWIFRGIRWCFRGIGKLFGLLPLIWQWLATAAAMVIVPGICLLLAAASHSFGRAFWAMATAGAIFADIGLVCYGAYAFGVLLRHAKRLSQGQLHTRIDTKYLYGPFYDFAQELNALADVAVTAAKKQMHSERMKTELITNVSHDIKTPLTSIINYVDILQSTEDPQQRQQYLQVLARQSQQMKRLLEDLLEMSKATSGNLNVECRDLDAAEAVNQALGEYADRLAQCALTPVVRLPQEPVMIYADGRLTWRVLSNLLSNVVKYALPGTRMYLEVAKVEDWAELSVKNISREEMNMSAEELMERFVRGDASRNTEGSGLGLNIAQSLMEAQGGSLALHLDGDLFKVTLRFPMHSGS